MVWQLAFCVLLTWSIMVIVIAVVSRKQLDASANPLEWIPFFFVGPIVLVGIVVLAALMIPMSLVLIAAAITTYPFQRIVSVESDGLALTNRLGFQLRLIRWSELHEVKELTFIPSLVAVLKSGDEVELVTHDDEALRRALEAHDVDYNVENDAVGASK